MLLLCVQSLCMQYTLRTIHCVYNTLFVSNAFCVQITFTCVTFKALTCGTLSIKTSSLTFLFLIHNKLFIFNVIFSFQLLLNITLLQFCVLGLSFHPPVCLFVAPSCPFMLKLSLCVFLLCP